MHTVKHMHTVKQTQTVQQTYTGNRETHRPIDEQNYTASAHMKWQVLAMILRQVLVLYSL